MEANATGIRVFLHESVVILHDLFEFRLHCTEFLCKICGNRLTAQPTSG